MNQIILLLSAFTLIILVSADPDAGKYHISQDGNLLFIETNQEFNWFQAQQECVRRLMTLVSIDSVQKHLEIYDRVSLVYREGKVPRLWIGGHDNANSRQFEWISTGQRFNFTNWVAYEPNNGDEHCVALWPEYLGWNDAPCTYEIGFICELNPLLKSKGYELMEAIEELELLQQSSAMQTMTELTHDLKSLRKSCDEQTIQLKEKQELLNAVMENFERKVNQTSSEINEELLALKALSKMQTDELNQQHVDRETLIQDNTKEETTIEPISGSTFENIGNPMYQQNLEPLNETREKQSPKRYISGKKEIVSINSHNYDKDRKVTNRFYNFVLNINES